MALLLIKPVYSADNLIKPEIADLGAWTNESNIQLFKTNITKDMEAFQPKAQSVQTIEDYVPIEAKVGLAFMNALSFIGDIIDNSLGRFIIIFIIIAYIFWAAFETYNMMTKDGNAMELVQNLLKRAVILSICIIILIQGPAELFMMIIGPIISISTYLSDLILNTVANIVGAELPDTCTAIHEYTTIHTSTRMLIDPQAAANILCVPTRLSGFFSTAISAGWQWMIAGIGTSAFTVLVGVVFILLFIYNMWKFALMALGVIIDLFLAILLLPFTAVAESIQKTSYKGVAGNIFNGFLDLFKTSSFSLSSQINRFIKAAIYFVSLSIVISLCTALLSGTIKANLAAQIPTLENTNFMIILLTGCLVAYLANNADKIAKDIGGDKDDSFGTDFGKNITKLWQGAYKKSKNILKTIKESKK